MILPSNESSPLSDGDLTSEIQVLHSTGQKCKFIPVLNVLFFAVENPKHCEFSHLRNMLIRTHMQDLKEVTDSIHYENFRRERLAAKQKFEKAEESRC